MALSNSPFANRLNTNYIPSDSEILEIRALLVDPLEEIARIDAQIAQLREKRALLQEPVDAHKALISSMRLIPQDILQEIFISCLPTKHNALIDHNEAPLLLGRINRHWRQIAYSTPRLWSSIHIPLSGYLSAPPNILLESERFIGAWLQRSAPCPLSVSLFGLDNRRTLKVDKHPIILLLAAEAGRLRSLALDGDAELAKPLLQLRPEEVPLLKTIGLKTIPRDNPTLDILRTPSLEDIALCISAPDDPLSLPLPWSQLTTLRFDCHGSRHVPDEDLNFEGALDVLRKCVNLEYCAIRVSSRSSQNSGLMRNSSSIVMPRLHTLFLGGGRFHLERWTLDLVAPNLRSLQIREAPTGTASPNHGCLSVDIDVIRFTSTSLHELLQSFPMISHLQLLTFPIMHTPREWLNDEFMGLFGPPHNLCPVLTDITFMLTTAGFSDTAILAFIRARMAMPNPLRRFQAHFNRPMELDIIPELQPFVSEGLEVTLKFPPLPWAFRAGEGLNGGRSVF
ncbi:hypothetical protein C8R45DRAFT_441359 [Mycena sanguinolenta]|nr:hypothetical protein C8R45DRAFT_441359 [Mycena sanguinolenta]